MANKKDIYNEINEIDKEIQNLQKGDHVISDEKIPSSGVEEQSVEELSGIKNNKIPSDISFSIEKTLRDSIREELKNSGMTMGDDIFTSFSEKAIPFLEQRVRALERATYGLNKTIESWAGLSIKTICAGIFSAISIGVLTYSIAYWTYPPNQLSQNEQRLILYGQVLSENFNNLVMRDQELLAQQIENKRKPNKKTP